MMRRGLSALALAWLLPAAAAAQVERPSQPDDGPRSGAPAQPDAPRDASAGPIVRVGFEETEAIPGQPLDLRLTVLVPTFMPEPPVWPGLEAPNLLVRLPEGSTSPVSESIGGETWSGVSRRYRISPMVPGDFAIAPQPVVVTYVDPETNAPLRVTLATDAIAFAGVLPEGAEGLDPFVAADALELSQEVSGDPSAMVPGDSFTRTVTARVTGTSAMFVPDLLAAEGIDGLAVYPGAPLIEEADDRSRLSGTRTESVTYVAEGGGSGEVPKLSLAWYDLGSGEVETASLDGFPVAVDGPPARSTAPRDWSAVAMAGVLSVLVLAIAVWLVRRAAPPVRRRARRWRAARLASEARAFGVLERTVSARDHVRLYPALDDWTRKAAGSDPRRHPELARALTDLGAARYGAVRGNEADAWRRLARALTRARRSGGGTAPARGALPPLNPGA